MLTARYSRVLLAVCALCSSIFADRTHTANAVLERGVFERTVVESAISYCVSLQLLCLSLLLFTR